MPEAGSVLKFDALGKTVRHPFVIYADFEALLIKPDISDNKGGNTNIVEDHKLMSYGFFVKAADNIPIDILKQYNIPLTPIWFRGSQTINSEEVAKRFVEAIVEVATNISGLLQTNTPIKFTDTEAQRFLDSCRFTPSCLSALTTDLAKAGLSNFRETAKVFCPEDMPLVTKKGVFPYSFVDDWSKLEVTSLPAREQFFNSLTGKHISIKDYEHALQVWNHFKCKTLGEYSDIYMKVDIMALTDVFEQFRNLCMDTYNLDAVFYFTSPGLSFDAMLKHSMVHLDLLNDYEMVLLIENGIRGGLIQACTRWAKANNPKTPGYNPDKPNTWLVYQDATNLYGYAMSRYMPSGSFQWYTGSGEEALKGLDSMTEQSETGMIFEVDIAYPSTLHDEHNEYPFLPELKCPPNSKTKKLLATLEDKKKYVIHYMNLKQAIANGLKVEKVHRVLQFHQSPWLASYIDLNTQKRFAVLELSKVLMYEYHYNVMRKHFKDVIEFVYGDTDSLIYLIKTQDFYEDVRKTPELLSRLDTSNLPIDHPCYSVERKKVPGTFTDELAGLTMHEIIALRSKLYGFSKENVYKSLETEWSIRAYVTKKHMVLDDLKRCLFDDDSEDDMDIYGFNKAEAKLTAHNCALKTLEYANYDLNTSSSTSYRYDYTPYRENISIRSFKHKICTVKTMKLALNRNDDKRIVLCDRIHTLAIGHYKIK
ncbi:uncharacterized protein LOC126837795 [Adelges cooleyi]|uniref:uncharacterized protein LOC126837795 n=1 Tax=Adelges cooleyi TaxID=133065 RepID=UPI00217F5EE3|nr:uncharacterized protein LOC126837795 [Adelges cooleyi]